MVVVLRSVVLVFAVVALLTGCTFNQNSEFFKTQPVIKDGAPITEETWAAMDAARAEGKDSRLSSKGSFAFPLPGLVRIQTFAAGQNPETKKTDKADSLLFVWNDLLTPYLGLTLPLRAKFRLYHYERGTPLPAGFRGITYSPFVFEDRAIGKVDPNLELKARGLPLLFADFKARYAEADRDRRHHFRANTFLWTLGPAVAKYRAEAIATADAETTAPLSRGYLAAPLLLGGAPGAVLWTDYHIRIAETKDSAGQRFVGHGPFLGFLGYFDSKVSPKVRTEITTSADGTERVETQRNIDGSRKVHVLGGILWHHYTRRDAATSVRLRYRNGPLWGAFGWGHDGDRFNIRFLYIPIG